MLKPYRFFLLSGIEKRLFIKAVFFLIYYRLRLWISPLQDILQGARQEPVLPLLNNSRDIQPRRIAELITKASRFVPKSTCFSIALAGKKMFEQNGYPSHLKIGVVKDSRDKLAAHAWLVFEDTVILCNLPDLDKFVEMPLGLLG